MVEIENRVLVFLGWAVSWIFDLLCLGGWKGTVAVISTEMAKEQDIGTLVILNGVADPENDELVMAVIKTIFIPLSAFSFLVLNLFDPSCVVAMATIAREMNNKFWAVLAIGYQVISGYGLSFIVYQLGGFLFYGAAFGAGQIAARVLILLVILCIIRSRVQLKDNTVGAQA